MESEILEREINVDLPDNQILISYQALRSIFLIFLFQLFEIL